MRIQCSDDPHSSEYHVHYSWADFQKCVGPDRDFRAFVLRPKPATPTTTTPDATAAGSEPMRADSGSVPTTDGVRDPGARPTGKQLWRINKEGGSWRDAYLGNRGEASAIIGQLLKPGTKSAWQVPIKPLDDDDWDMFPQERAYRRGELGPEWESFEVDTGELNGIGMRAPSVSPVKPEPASRPEPETFRHRPGLTSEEDKSREALKIMLPLLEKVAEGYFAAEIDSGMHNDLKFFRLSRPTKGDYKGCVKLQWQLADRWEIAWVLYPSGRQHFTVKTFDVAAYLLAIMSNPNGCMRKYAKMIDKCCRCNTTLTDERSRHYGIGPECEKYKPEIIEMVDLEDAIKREEGIY